MRNVVFEQFFGSSFIVLIHAESCFPTWKKGTGDRDWRASAPTWSSTFNLLPTQRGPRPPCR